MRAVFRNMFTRPWPQRIGRETIRTFPILSSGRVTVFDPLFISASLNQSFALPCHSVYEKLEAGVSILVSRASRSISSAGNSKERRKEARKIFISMPAGGSPLRYVPKWSHLRWSGSPIRTLSDAVDVRLFSAWLALRELTKSRGDENCCWRRHAHLHLISQPT